VSGTSSHFNPLIVTIVPENEDQVRTIAVASIKAMKSRNALIPASGWLLKVVCVSPSAMPMSICPPWMPSSAISTMHWCARSLLPNVVGKFRYINTVRERGRLRYLEDISLNAGEAEKLDKRQRSNNWRTASDTDH